MDRRKFLGSLAIAPFVIKGLSTQQAAASNPGLYGEQLQNFLERELELDYIKYALERESIQKENLRTAFRIVRPKTNTDLAFVVWCGDKYIPVTGLAYRYRDSRLSGKSHCDHYPFISLEQHPVPYTAGIFAFREELASLVAELADLNLREAMQSLFAIYRGSHEQIQCNKINAADLHDMLKPAYRNRYTHEEIKRLHAFISDCYGRSGYYSFAAITAERAQNMLLSDKACPAC